MKNIPKKTVLLVPLIIGTTLILGGGAAEATNVTVTNMASIVNHVKNKRMQCDNEDPRYAHTFYVRGSNNVLNLNLTGNLGGSFYASPMGGGNGHTTNFTSGQAFSVFGGAGNNNTLNISGSVYTGFAYGGYSEYNKETSGNRLYVKGGNFSAGTTLGGGRSGVANNNVLVVSGGTFEQSDAAARSLSDEWPAEETVDDPSAKGGHALLWGGEGYTSATGNTVDISGFTGNIYQIMGGRASNGNASNNTVMTGKGNGVYTGILYGGSASGNKATANNNSVQILGGTYNCYIAGGTASASSDTIGTASNNTVEIMDGIFNGLKLHGGRVGSYQTPGVAYGNTVVIQDGKFLGTASEIIGGYANEGRSERNSVVINGGDFTQGSMYIYAGDTGMKGVELNNSIELYQGKLNNVTLFGTRYKWGADQLKNANPVLNVYGSNFTVKNIANFARLNYYLPDAVKNGDTILNVVGTDSTVLTNTTIGVSVPGGTNLNVGDKVTLLYNQRGIFPNEEQVTAEQLTEGVSIDYGMELSYEEGDRRLVGTLTSGTYSGDGSVHLKEQTKSLVETTVAGMAALNASADFVASHGFSAAAAAASANAGSFSPFFAAGGSNMRYDTGSHVDSRGYSLAIGLAKEFKIGSQTLLMGPFFEHGGASYDSYLDDDKNTKANGTNRFTGGGWFVRGEQDSGFLYEASVRFGHLTSDYNGKGDMKTSYDSGSNYFGFHLGLGNRWKVNERGSMDLYGKYFYTHQDSDDVKLTSGELYHFDTISSSRTRLGLRYTHRASELCSVYGGVAWDYEFDSDARATYRGLSTPTPSLKGSSGMAELGVKFKPNEKTPLTMDVSVQGWTGKQRGVGANLALQWNF